MNLVFRKMTRICRRLCRLFKSRLKMHRF